MPRETSYEGIPCDTCGRAYVPSDSCEACPHCEVARLREALLLIDAVQVDPARERGMSLFDALMFCKQHAAKALGGD